MLRWLVRAMKRLTRLPWGRLAAGACATAVVLASAVSLAPGGRDWVAWRIAEGAGRGDINAEAARQALVALGDETAEGLAPLALGGDRATADHARVAIDTRIDLWLSRSTPGAARRLTALLRAVEASVPDATESGIRWGTKLAERAAASSESGDPREGLALTRAAEHLLERLSRASGRFEEPIKVATQPEPIDPYGDGDEIDVLLARNAERSTRRSAAAIPPAAAPPLADSPVEPPAAVQQQPDWDPSWEKPLANLTREGGQHVAEAPVAAARASEVATTVAPAVDPSLVRPAAPVPYSERDDRQLLTELLRRADEVRKLQEPRTARGPSAVGPSEKVDGASSVRALLDELASRGYRGLSVAHLEAITADDPRVRMRLAEQLLLDSATDAPRLLLVLSQDPDGGVREAAITALGSSPHRAHVEAAWRIALNDTDPRVGRHASRLKARLD
ncbi:MAG: hypothetical protein ACRCT8_02410 [Lacipirellulaceae bacterium]